MMSHLLGKRIARPFPVYIGDPASGDDSIAYALFEGTVTGSSGGDAVCTFDDSDIQQLTAADAEAGHRMWLFHNGLCEPDPGEFPLVSCLLFASSVFRFHAASVALPAVQHKGVSAVSIPRLYFSGDPNMTYTGVTVAANGIYHAFVDDTNGNKRRAIPVCLQQHLVP